MRKYRVRNHKKTERVFMEMRTAGDYLESVSRFGDKAMYIWKEGGERHELSFNGFIENVRDFAKGLDSVLPECGTVAIIGETAPYWTEAYLAVIASGRIVVPMDKELAPEEISKFFVVAGVNAVVYSPSFDSVMAAIAEGHETLKALIPWNHDAKAGGNVVPFDTIMTAGHLSTREFVPDPDTERCCQMLFTSGTTGSSKCVMHCQRNIFTTMTAACLAADYNDKDVLVSVLPLHHTYELCCQLAAINCGGTICINDSIRHVMKSMQEYKPTGIVLVPLFVNTMYKKILSEAKKNGKDKALVSATKIAHQLSFLGIDLSEKLFRDVREAFGGRLEKITCGGAALNPELVQTFEAFGISIYEGYGITECTPLVALDPYYRRRPGSVGTTVSCCETRIEGTEMNEAGYLTGEIEVRGSNVMLGYLNNDEANNAVFTPDGWFKTGDIGYKDSEGYIYITGRAKSVIVLDNGKNVFPEEIEEYLGDIELIAESVVVGREEEEGTVLTAVIFPNYAKFPDLQENEFRTEIQKQITALNKKLPSFKQIRKLDFRKTEFEKTSSRKIKRHLVK